MPDSSRPQRLGDQLADLARTFTRRQCGPLPCAHNVVIRLLPDGTCQGIDVVFAGPAAGAEEEVAPRPTARHSSDFRSVNTGGGTAYTFTRTQADVVRRLWEAAENGTPDVNQAELLTAAESDGKRLRDVFRDHDAFGSWIVSDGKGNYRLTHV